MHRCNSFTYPWDIINVGATDACLPSWLTLHPHPCYCSASNCLPSRPFLLTHEVWIRAVQEFWELGVWLSSVTALIKTLASVVLILGDKLNVRVRSVSRITPLLTLSISKYFPCSPSYENTASSISMGSGSQTANRVLQKIKVKNSHWNFGS